MSMIPPHLRRNVGPMVLMSFHDLPADRDLTRARKPGNVLRSRETPKGFYPIGKLENGIAGRIHGTLRGLHGERSGRDHDSAGGASTKALR